MLESNHFRSSSIFEFGSRRPDFGWQAETLEAMREWFGAALNLCGDLAIMENIGMDVRRALAWQIRYLAVLPGLNEDVVRIAASSGWPEGAGGPAADASNERSNQADLAYSGQLSSADTRFGTARCSPLKV